MQYCKKCNKIIEKDEKTYRELCFSCYQEYLYKKIDHFIEENSPSQFNKKENNKIINSIKNFFQKRKK